MEKEPKQELPKEIETNIYEENLSGIKREILSGENLTLNTIKDSEIIIDNGAKLTVKHLINCKVIVRPKGLLNVLEAWQDCDITWEKQLNL